MEHVVNTGHIRRWFHFSLRTLLIAVAVGCAFFAFLGRQASIVHARHVAIVRIEQGGGSVLTWERQHLPPGMCSLSYQTYEVRIPRLRAWLGDQPIDCIEARNDGDFELARACFPEAEVVHVSSDGQEFVPFPRQIPAILIAQ